MSFSLPENPQVFENLVFDLLQYAGMENVVWRTPGSDGGRDIECNQRIVDFSGYSAVYKWHVECKRYSNSIDWPTVFAKIGYAITNKADYLLIVTNSNPSPNCENEISKWNNSNHLQIRCWPGYDLIRIIKNFPVIADKYGVDPTRPFSAIPYVDLLNLVMKLSQVSYTSFELAQNPRLSLSAASALSELISLRAYEKATDQSPFSDLVEDFTMNITGLNKPVNLVGWNETSTRAIISYIIYVLKGQIASVTQNGDRVWVFHNRTRSIGETARGDLTKVATLCNFELAYTHNSIAFSKR